MKGITFFSKKHVAKQLVEALTSCSNIFKLLQLLVDPFLLSKVVALHKLGQIILW